MENHLEYQMLANVIKNINLMDEVKERFLVLSKSQNQELADFLLETTEYYISDIIVECRANATRENYNFISPKGKVLHIFDDIELSEKFEIQILVQISKLLRKNYNQQVQLLLSKNIDINHLELLIYSSQNIIEYFAGYCKNNSEKKEYESLMAIVYSKLYNTAIEIYNILDKEKILLINDEFKIKVDNCKINEIAKLIYDEVYPKLSSNETVEDTMFTNGIKNLHTQYSLMADLFINLNLQNNSTAIRFVATALLNETELLNKNIELIDKNSKFMPYLQLLDQKYKQFLYSTLDNKIKVKQIEK